MIGERLKKLRIDGKLTQDDLATIIGVNKSAVSHYETNKDDPSDKIKVEIARYFNISLDYLLGLIDVQVPIYTENIFLRLPQSMCQKEKRILSEFLSFIEYKRNKI